VADQQARKRGPAQGGNAKGLQQHQAEHQTPGRLHTERQHKRLHQHQAAQLTYSLGGQARAGDEDWKVWTINKPTKRPRRGAPQPKEQLIAPPPHSKPIGLPAEEPMWGWTLPGSLRWCCCWLLAPYGGSERGHGGGGLCG